MKKKLLVLFSILVVASLALSACGAAATPAAPEKKVWTYADMTIGFLQTGSEGGWRAANTASFKESAEQLGINLKFYDSQNDLAKQVAGFQQFIADPEVDVIAISPLEAAGWEQVLKDAKAAGKPVILSDRRIDGNEDLYVTFVGADFVEEGRKSVPRCANCSKAVLQRTSGNSSAMWVLHPPLTVARVSARLQKNAVSSSPTARPVTGVSSKASKSQKPG